MIDETELLITFHTQYLNTVFYNTSNICINRFGINAYRPNYVLKTQSLQVIDSIRGIVKNESKLLETVNLQSIEHRPRAIFNLIHFQNEILAEGKKIKRGIKIAEKRDDQVCPICYKTHDETFIYELSCEHSFCYECLDKHIASSSNKTCPLCRKDVAFKFKP